MKQLTSALARALFDYLIALLRVGHELSYRHLALGLVVNGPGTPKSLHRPIAASDSCRIVYHIQSMEVAACLPDDGRLAELNRQFHFRIYECARSPMLLLLMRLLWRSFPHGPQAGRPHQESVRQHDALVRALKHRNEEQVAAIIRDHVLGSIKYLPQQ